MTWYFLYINTNLSLKEGKRKGIMKRRNNVLWCGLYGLISFCIAFFVCFIFLYKQTVDYANINEYAGQHINESIMHDIILASVYSILTLVIALIVGSIFEVLSKEKKYQKLGMLIVPVITVVISCIAYFIIFILFFHL